jgi:sRNA-binding carbon storage regulator CsrA
MPLALSRRPGQKIIIRSERTLIHFWFEFAENGTDITAEYRDPQKRYIGAVKTHRAIIMGDIIDLGQGISAQIVSIHEQFIRFAFTAPHSVAIDREEIAEAKANNFCE